MSLQKGEIRPAAYQLLPLTKILVNGANSVLIADGVGVGKTISAGYIILYLSQHLNKPAAVIAPPILIPKWIQELRSKFGISAFAVRSIEEVKTAKAESALRRAGVQPASYIISSSLIGKVKPSEYPNFSVIAFDEIHNFRNRTTALHASALAMAKRSPYRIGLTATPINNSLDDLISELRILLADESWEAVAEAVREAWVAGKSGVTLPLVTRFTKNKLGQEFAKRRITTKVAVYPESYARRVREVVRGLRQKRPTWNALEGITYYRLATSSHVAFEKTLRIKEPLLDWDPKLDILRGILSQEEVSHWLVFCEFEETVQYLERMVNEKPIFTLTGGTPMFDREAIIKAFRDSESGAMIMTPVGTEGLDLQFCGGVVNYDLHWNPMRLEQRVGRIDRLGQKKPIIEVVNILVAGSIDERVLEIIKRKLELISKSIFAVGALFDWSAKVETKAGSLLDEETLQHELKEGTKLVETLKLNETIDEGDYSVLESVDLAYCDPVTLADTAIGGRTGPVWIGGNSVAGDWIREISTRGNEFIELVRFYR